MLNFYRRTCVLIAVFTFSIIGAFAANAAVVTWDDGGGDSNWSTCENWVGDACPGSSDVATFDGTSDTASTIDAGFAGSVQGLDVNADDQYADHIQFAYDYGLINGYPDGTFHSDRILNRAEALKICFEFYQIAPDEYLLAFETPFVDVDMEAWYYPYLVHSVEYGVIQGHLEDMTFRPANAVSYAEMLKIATLIKNLDSALQLASELELE